MLLLSPSCTHAAANTPAEPVGARVTRFPTAVSLPRINGGSASALPVSRPAQRSLRVAACVLAESPSGDPSSSECFSAFRCLPAPLRLLPGWSDSCRAGFAPAGTQRLSTAHANNQVATGAAAATIMDGHRRRGSPYRIARRRTCRPLSRSAARIDLGLKVMTMRLVGRVSLRPARRASWLRYIGGRLKSDYKLFSGSRLQYLSDASRECGLVKTGTSGTGRARCPRLSSLRDAGQSLRS